MEASSERMPNPSRRGHYIRTFTGRQYWPMDPHPEDIVIEDVAHALSNLCRFTGHTSRFYSVAEHSVHVSFIVPPEYAFIGLMHDAHEAYVNDIARPFKLMLPGYQAAEEQNWLALAMRFGIPREIPPPVKSADTAAFRAERLELMPCGPTTASDVTEPGPVPYLGRLGMMPQAAEDAFLQRFHELEPR